MKGTMTERDAGDIAHQQTAALRIASVSGDQRIDKDELSCSGDSSGIQTPERKERLREQGNTTPSNVESYAPNTPLTPTANLKVLIAAAAASSEFVEEGSLADTSGRDDVGVVEEEIEDKSSGRKMKSLAMLCNKFLAIVEGDIGTGKEFSLETMAQSLAINRRRIYDIINVLEALEMISKQSKNWYIWLGRTNLVATLAKLKAMAVDDADFQTFFENKENEGPPSANFTNSNDSGCKSSPESEDDSFCGGNRTDSSLICREEVFLYDSDTTGKRSVRLDKSLGVLCQKFVMLFLVSPNNEITLDAAGTLLVPDGIDDSNPFASMNPSTNPKTKVRRLYDIANILMSLGLIRKKTFIGPAHTKRPGYTWCGASMKEIDAIPVHRKHEQSALKLKGPALSRRASYGPGGSSRPFLHQYEVKGVQQPYSSAMCVSSDKKGFKRSLSFGATPNQSRPSGGVTVRPLGTKQIEYMNEVKEFEAEVQKHSDRYPHVASVFHEFIHRYKNTLEQAASVGRMILPKQPPDSSNMSSIVENLVSNLLVNPGLKCSSTQTSGAGSGSPDHNTSAHRTERDASPTRPLHSPKVCTPTASTSFANAEEFLSTTERTPSETLTPKSSIYAMVPLSRSTPTRSSPSSALPFPSPLSFTRSEATSSLATHRGNEETSPPKKQKLELELAST